MDLVTWDKSYRVNVECCDAEHRKLFSLINALHEAMMSGKSRAIIAGTVHELEKYTQTHFLAEEALMQRASRRTSEIRRPGQAIQT
jgi:hemerythrin-like metal-binding protein